MNNSDFCSENILVQDELRTVIIDFGLATRTTEPCEGLCGSEGFYAPEMLLEAPYMGEKVDVWGFGCILLELALGSTQFDTEWLKYYRADLTPSHFASKLEEWITKKLEDRLAAYSDGLRVVIRKALTIDPRARPSMTDLLQHSWFEVQPSTLQQSKRAGVTRFLDRASRVVMKNGGKRAMKTSLNISSMYNSNTRCN